MEVAKETWFSVPKRFTEYANTSSNRSRTKDLIMTLIEKTNYGTTSIRFDGNSRILVAGQCFFTYTELGQLLQADPKTIKRDLEKFSKVEPFTLEVSKSKGSGGVILTWKNWEEIVRPWKKNSSLESADQSPIKVQSKTPDKKEFQAGQKKSNPEKSDHINIININKNINTNSLSNTKPDEKLNKPEQSEEVREIVKFFKNKFPQVPCGAVAQARFECELHNRGFDKTQALKAIDSLSKDDFLNKTINSINGIFFEAQRRADRKVFHDMTNCPKTSSLEAFKTLQEWASHPNRNWKYMDWNLTDFENYFQPTPITEPETQANQHVPSVFVPVGDAIQDEIPF